MGHTTPPLRVGFDGVKGYAVPDKLKSTTTRELKCSRKRNARFDLKNMTCLTTLSVSTPVLITGTPKYKMGQLSLTSANMESCPHRKRKITALQRWGRVAIKNDEFAFVSIVF
jgi:hypothetical protein